MEKEIRRTAGHRLVSISLQPSAIAEEFQTFETVNETEQRGMMHVHTCFIKPHAFKVFFEPTLNFLFSTFSDTHYLSH